MPSQIEQVHRHYGDRLRIVAIDIQESREKVEAWVKAKSLSVSVVLDANGSVASAYEVTATPTVFVLSREGKLVGKALGSKAWNSERGRALLDRLTGS